MPTNRRPPHYGFTRLCPALFAAAALAACASGMPPEAKHAKNVILFIGDGMGVTTVTATRIFDGQAKGLPGEENVLAFERFPHVALVKTYNTNQQVPDSAGTATAMMTGVKTSAGVIGIGPEAKRRSCEDAKAYPLEALSEVAKRRGKAVGFVTTTRVTHATPATVYARTPERDWESDQFMTDATLAAGCRDIAWQLVHGAPGSGLDVAMGGGRQNFFGEDGGGVRRTPSDDLVAEWLSSGGKRRYIETAAELATIGGDEQVLGLFARSHLAYVAERGQETSQPTLTEMTVAAIERLAAAEDGYFLMVEGGRIDHGHHDGRPGYALLEAQSLVRAIEAALDLVDLEETLVLVTADHSHALTMAGYPTRGNPILGLVVGNDKSGRPKDGPTIAADGQPYTTLAYQNGPGAVTGGNRPEPETGIGMLAQSLVPLANQNIDGSITNDETHGGEDVALYANGVGAERVGGVMEQNRIHDIMRRAYGWGGDSGE